MQKIILNDQRAVFYHQILQTVISEGCIRHCNFSVLNTVLRPAVNACQRGELTGQKECDQRTACPEWTQTPRDHSRDSLFAYKSVTADG